MEEMSNASDMSNIDLQNMESKLNASEESNMALKWYSNEIRAMICMIDSGNDSEMDCKIKAMFVLRCSNMNRFHSVPLVSVMCVCSKPNLLRICTRMHDFGNDAW